MEAALFTMRVIMFFSCASSCRRLYRASQPGVPSCCRECGLRVLACEAACYAAYCPCQVPRAPCLASALALSGTQSYMHQSSERLFQVSRFQEPLHNNVWLLRKPVPAQLARRHVTVPSFRMHLVAQFRRPRFPA